MTINNALLSNAKAFCYNCLKGCLKEYVKYIMHETPSDKRRSFTERVYVLIHGKINRIRPIRAHACSCAIYSSYR